MMPFDGECSTNAIKVIELNFLRQMSFDSHEPYRGVALLRLVKRIAQIDIASVVVCEHVFDGSVHRTGRKMRLLLPSLVLVAAAASGKKFEGMRCLQCLLSSDECCHLMSA